MTSPARVLDFKAAIRPVNDKLRRQQQRKSISQTEIARRTGRSQPAVSSYLRDSLPQSLTTLQTIAAMLDVNAQEIRQMLMRVIDSVRPIRSRLAEELVEAANSERANTEREAS